MVMRFELGVKITSPAHKNILSETEALARFLNYVIIIKNVKSIPMIYFVNYAS